MQIMHVPAMPFHLAQPAGRAVSQHCPRVPCADSAAACEQAPEAQSALEAQAPPTTCRLHDGTGTSALVLMKKEFEKLREVWLAQREVL